MFSAVLQDSIPRVLVYPSQSNSINARQNKSKNRVRSITIPNTGMTPGNRTGMCKHLIVIMFKANIFSKSTFQTIALLVKLILKFLLESDSE